MTTEEVVIGRELSGQDNPGYFYEDADVEACPECGLVLDGDWVSPTFVPPRKRYELSHTYDGVTIVGERLADRIRDWAGVQLDQLPAAPTLYRLSSTQVVEVDLEQHPPNRTHLCETCGRFKYVSTGGNRWLKTGTTIPDGLVRTDLGYGSAFDHPENRMLQEPMLIVNHHFWSLIDQARLGVRGTHIKAQRTTTAS